MLLLLNDFLDHLNIVNNVFAVLAMWEADVELPDLSHEASAIDYDEIKKED